VQTLVQLQNKQRALAIRGTNKQQKSIHDEAARD
jgi:hypothetical protein